MSITLPAAPMPQSWQPRLMDFGGRLTPFLGGAVQRINRLGTRWSLQVSLPTLEADEARLWISRLVQAVESSGVLAWPQPGVDVGAEGTPRVNGGGQLGMSLAVDGLPASKALKEGWFFSIVTGGRRYVHMITADVTASGGGAATLSIFPMLRRAPSDNAVIELAAPMIEGLVEGDAQSWDVDQAALYGLSFTLSEAE